MILRHYRFFSLIFFFQAEDGIRDRDVTGVQTCALPIYHRWGKVASQSLTARSALARVLPSGWKATDQTNRSEERRVGKECRSRWWRYPQKKKSIAYATYYN